MKKLFLNIVASFKRGSEVVCSAEPVRAVATPAEILARLQVLNSNYLPATFLPATKRVRLLAFKLEEIAKQAGEAERDILEAFEHGHDIHQRIGDLHGVFKSYGDCFAELEAENHKLAHASRIYAGQLEPFLQP